MSSVSQQTDWISGLLILPLGSTGELCWHLCSCLPDFKPGSAPCISLQWAVLFSAAQFLCHIKRDRHPSCLCPSAASRPAALCRGFAVLPLNISFSGPGLDGKKTNPDLWGGKITLFSEILLHRHFFLTSCMKDHHKNPKGSCFFKAAVLSQLNRGHRSEKELFYWHINSF